MINSNEPPKVDYSKLPPETEEAIARKPYTIEEKAKLTWDGRQFLVRIPKEIAQEIGITKENFILFRLIKPLPDSTEKPKLEMELK
jgi:hypothetical protein